ncbi:DegQ family serine endoprotease [Dongia soli]|uniref:Probable periplasmic serine endoprotease DegP-like n=1 Tax=Dongia soli TaxID=600628 RepID=A0ABU5E667_9PROT|nr:DegQ family serine endoprotease [Dongia soli]MDY0881807.1 DegQ family serine endoprotease [Dongia soli]
MKPPSSSGRRAKRLAAALAAGSFASLALLGQAEAYPAPDSFADLAAKVTPAVVNISSSHKIAEAEGQQAMPFEFPKGSPFDDLFRPFMDQQRQHHPNRKVMSLGSGFIIDASGYVVTNNHVIDDASDIEVTTTDGKQYPAKLVGTDPKTDLAVLKIDAKQSLPFVTFGDSDKERVGDWVMAVGNPFGLGGTVTAGIVSARGRDINEGPFDDFLQIDAAINQGNSGGPTFSTNGEVIGINTAIASPNGGSVGIGFAIPSNMAKPVIEALREHGSVERGWLGVQIQKVTPDLAKAMGLQETQGALVAGVQPEGPAAKVLKPGDVVVSYNGQTVEDMRDLPRLVANTRPETKVELTVWRNHEMQRVSVVIGKLKAEEKVASTDEDNGDNQAADQGGVAVASLGASFAPVNADTRREFNLDDNAKGVVVTDIDEDSPLAAQGVSTGDIIERIGDHEVSKPEQLRQMTKEAKANRQDVVMMLVNHRGQELFIAVKLADA